MSYWDVYWLAVLGLIAIGIFLSGIAFLRLVRIQRDATKQRAEITTEWQKSVAILSGDVRGLQQQVEAFAAAMVKTGEAIGGANLQQSADLRATVVGAAARLEQKLDALSNGTLQTGKARVEAIDAIRKVIETDIRTGP